MQKCRNTIKTTKTALIHLTLDCAKRFEHNSLRSRNTNSRWRTDTDNTGINSPLGWYSIQLNAKSREDGTSNSLHHAKRSGASAGATRTASVHRCWLKFYQRGEGGTQNLGLLNGYQKPRFWPLGRIPFYAIAQYCE